MICQPCQSEFEPVRQNQRFCSAACRARGQKTVAIRVPAEMASKVKRLVVAGKRVHASGCVNEPRDKELHQNIKLAALWLRSRAENAR